MTRYDILDVEAVVQSAFEAFCQQYGITGRTERQKALKTFADVARDLRGRQ